MSSVKKTFTFPKAIWDPFQQHIDDHPELSYSGMLQKFIKDFIGENNLVPCHSEQ